MSYSLRNAYYIGVKPEITKLWKVLFDVGEKCLLY